MGQHIKSKPKQRRNTHSSNRLVVGMLLLVSLTEVLPSDNKARNRWSLDVNYSNLDVFQSHTGAWTFSTLT